MNRRRQPRKLVRRLAHARIGILWEQARTVARERPDLARAWMRIASRIAQKARTRMPWHIRRHLCKRCGAVLVPGRNCRVRVRARRSTHVVVTCLSCGTIRRFPIKR